VAVTGVPAAAKSAEGNAPAGVDKEQLRQAYGRLPLSFEANRGQTDPRVDFLARGAGSTLFLTPTEAVFAIQNVESGIPNPEAEVPHALHSSPASGVALHMQIVGGDPGAAAVGREPLPGIVNYFLGSDPAQWHAAVPTYGRVEYANVYPGIDLSYYSSSSRLEYDFVVAPGANPRKIVLRLAGAEGSAIDAQGNLVLHTAVGDVVQEKPILYQEANGVREPIAGGFSLNPDGATQRSALLTFEVGAYDSTRPLVIDPVVLGYSSFLGGSGEERGYGIDVDRDGSAYLTGYTTSANFPITAGAFDPTQNGGSDAFVARLNADGTALIYSTFLGGSTDDIAYGITLDNAGNAYVTGATNSANFPTSTNAFDKTWNGSFDAFVTKLNPNGTSLSYSTFLGGSNYDDGWGIAVDEYGSAYVSGHTSSFNFAVTPGSFDTSYNGGINGFDDFVTKLTPDGTALAYSTYLGGSSDEYPGWTGIALYYANYGDGGGIYAAVTGTTYSADFPVVCGYYGSCYDMSYNGGGDAFLTSIKPDGSNLDFSTFLGGTGQENGLSVVIGSTAFWVTGHTTSSNFPTQWNAYDASYNGGDDAFVTGFGTGTYLVGSTYLGGGGNDAALGIAVRDDASGEKVYVAGYTSSTGFPTTSGAYDTTSNGGSYDSFLTELAGGAGVLAYSTYLGGSATDYGNGIAVDCHGYGYVVGDTGSSNFPAKAGSFDTTYNGGVADAFVTKFAGLSDNTSCPPPRQTLIGHQV
jgi:hypothetical protein